MTGGSCCCAAEACDTAPADACSSGAVLATPVVRMARKSRSRPAQSCWVMCVMSEEVQLLLQLVMCAPAAWHMLCRTPARTPTLTVHIISSSLPVFSKFSLDASEPQCIKSIYSFLAEDAVTVHSPVKGASPIVMLNNLSQNRANCADVRDHTQVNRLVSPRLSSKAVMPQASTRAVEQPM